MEHHETPIVVLLADDDDDDILLVTEAFKANFMVQELRIVHDGEELID